MAQWEPRKPHFLQLLDLDHYLGHKDGSLTYNEQPVERGDLAYFVTPFSAPAYCRWMRVLDKGAPPSPGAPDEPVTRLLAHTMELDVYPFGVKVFVRIGVDNTLKIITEDSEGRHLLETYTKEK